MNNKERKRLIREGTKEEKLKLVADRIYTDAEMWIQACIDSDSLLNEFLYRLNDHVVLRPPQK